MNAIRAFSNSCYDLALSSAEAVKKGKALCSGLVGRVFGRVLKTAVIENSAEFVGTYLGSKSVTTVGAKLASSYAISYVASTVIGSGIIGPCVVVAGGILGAFTLIRLTGNKDPLFNAEDPLRAYSTKALQQTIATEAFYYLTQAEFGPVSFIIEQMIASLAFNATDIVTCAKAIKDGKAFDGLLPDRLDVALLHELQQHLQIPEQEIKASTAFIVRAVNAYSTFLQEHTYIQSAQKAFDEAFERFSKEANAQERQKFYAQFQAKKQELLETCFISLNRQPKKAALHPANKYIDLLMENLKKLEEYVLGIAVTTKREALYLQECLSVQFAMLAEFIAWCLEKGKEFLKEGELLVSEVRSFYLNLVQLASKHYHFIVGPKLATSICKVLEKQIANSALYPVACS